MRLVNHLVKPERRVRLPGRARGPDPPGRTPRVRPLDPGADRRGHEPRHPLDPAERAVAGAAGAGQVPAAHPGHDDVEDAGPRRSTSPATRSSPRSCSARPGCRCRAARWSGPRTRRSQAARRIGYPVVTKPLDGNHGRGVGLDLRDDDAVRAGVRPRAGRDAPRRGRGRDRTSPGTTTGCLVVGGQHGRGRRARPRARDRRRRSTRSRELVDITNPTRAAASATRRS